MHQFNTELLQLHPPKRISKLPPDDLTTAALVDDKDKRNGTAYNFNGTRKKTDKIKNVYPESLEVQSAGDKRSDLTRQNQLQQQEKHVTKSDSKMCQQS